MFHEKEISLAKAQRAQSYFVVSWSGFSREHLFNRVLQPVFAMTPVK